MQKIGKLFPVWVITTCVTAVLLVIFIIGTSVAVYFEPALNTIMGTTNLKIVTKKDGDTKDTEYFKSDYAYTLEGEQKLQNDGLELFTNLVDEGAALLKNTNNALPIKSTEKAVTVFGVAGPKYITSFNTVLTEAGYTLNTTVWNHYNSQTVTARTRVGVPDWTTVTLPAIGAVGGANDIAIVTVGRRAGEGTDCAHPDEGSIQYAAALASDTQAGDYLDISAGEESMFRGVKALKDSGKFSKIICVINTSNMVHGDFINDPDFGIDACVWMGQAGKKEGSVGLLNVLEGKSNPSGRLVDTIYMNNLDNPVMKNFGRFTADLSGVTPSLVAEVDADAKQYHNNPNGGYWKNYVVYQEGIYLGYKYYETRYEDYVLGTGNAGSFIYDDYVAYPFGHGLSYTNWQYSNFGGELKGENFEITMTVKNSGSVPGKHSVLLYMQSPYTQYDKDNGIEKAAVSLVGFTKTGVVAAGATENVTVLVPKWMMRSYDSNKAKTYILDEGRYYFTAAGSSHEAINNILAKKGKTPANTSDKMDAAGTAANVYEYNVDALDTKIFSKAYANKDYTITNQFDDVDPNKDESAKKSNTVKWLSRKDWTGTLPTETFKFKYNDDLANDAKTIQYIADEKEQKDTKMPSFNVANSLTLAMFMDKDYDDPAWTKLLEQMSYEETAKMVMNCWYGSDGVKSVGKLRQTDQDSSSGRANPFTVSGLVGVTSTSGDLRAATFNKTIMEKVGIIQGENDLHASTKDVKAIGLYGYSPNIHRSPYSGRNGEYFSEDAYTTGIACGLGVKGMTDKGSVCFTKHYFLNDQEDYRHGISTWANEQTLRETYLPAFELTITMGGGMGFMNSFNRIGMAWVGEHKGAQLEFLYGECKFMGNIVTDLYEASHQDVIDGLLAHTTMWLGTSADKYSYGLLTSDKYKNDPVIVTALVEAAHRMLYGSSRSGAMNGISTDSTFVTVVPWWKASLIAAIVVFSVLTVASGTLLVLSIVQRTKAKAAA